MITALAVAAVMSFPFTVPYGACGGYAWRVVDDTGYTLETSAFGAMRAPGARDTASFPVPLDGRVRIYYLLAFNCDRTAWSVSNPVALAAGVAGGFLYGAYPDQVTPFWCHRPVAGYGTLRVAWTLPWVMRAAPIAAQLTRAPDSGGCP